jgi:hypothetical protein
MGLFIFATASRPALTCIPTGALSHGVKFPGREADHSPPSSAEVKMHRNIQPLPHGVLLS